MSSAPPAARPILWQGAHLKSIIIQGSGTSQRDNFFNTKFNLIINTSGHGNPKGRPQQLQGKGDSCQDPISRTSCLQICECCKSNGIRDLLSSWHSVWLSQPAAQISLELLCELNFLSFVDDLTYMRLPRPGSRNAGYCSGVRAPEKK